MVIRVATGIVLAVLLMLGQAQAEGVRVDDAWARASLPGAENGVAYITITNAGTETVRLVGMRTDVAAVAALHTHEVNDGVMQMRPLEGGVEISPGATVKFKPGGNHIMLMGLKAPLAEGETFELTLEFAEAGSEQAEVKVASATAMTAPDAVDEASEQPERIESYKVPTDRPRHLGAGKYHRNGRD